MYVCKGSISFYTLPCEDVNVEMEALPLCAHSFLKFKRIGVPGNSFSRRFCIDKPIVNIAVPELLWTHGMKILKSVK